MKKLMLRLSVLCFLIASGSSFGQEPAAAPEPTKEHRWLDQFSGQWKTQMKGTMGPDQPPMECRGTMSSRMLGGHWIVNEMKGEVAGEPMTGVQTIGYDASTEKYVGTWVDSMSAFMWRYEGSVDRGGKVLTLEADGPNFMAAGELTKFEDIYEFTSDKQIKITSRMLLKDGQWVTFMAGTATRVE